MAKTVKKSCLDYATYYLYRYPKTAKEMRTQLMKKNYSVEEIEDAMKTLKSKNYINDCQFAQLYLNSEVVNKGKPLAIMKQKLLFKGVDKVILMEVVEELEDGIQDGTIIRIIKEIDKLVAKDTESVSIIHKLMAKTYRLEDIKKALKIRKNSED